MEEIIKIRNFVYKRAEPLSDSLIVSKFLKDISTIFKPTDYAFSYLKKGNSFDGNKIIILNKSLNKVIGQLDGSGIETNVYFDKTKNTFKYDIKLILEQFINKEESENELRKLIELFSVVNCVDYNELDITFKIYQHWQTSDFYFLYDIRLKNSSKNLKVTQLERSELCVYPKLILEFEPFDIFGYLEETFDVALDFSKNLDEFKTQLSLISIQKI
jgi:hypothetical protein